MFCHLKKFGHLVNKGQMLTKKFFHIVKNKCKFTPIMVAAELPLILVNSKTCVKWPLSKRPKLVFKTNYRLMQVKSIAEWSILQYFRPSLSYQLLLRSLFCLFLSGRFTQVLL